MRLKNNTTVEMNFDLDGRSYKVAPGGIVDIHEDLVPVLKKRGTLLSEVDEDAELDVKLRERDAAKAAKAEAAKKADEAAAAEAKAKAEADAQAKAKEEADAKEAAKAAKAEAAKK